MKTKVTVNIPTSLLNWAREYSELEGTTATDVFKLALRTLMFIKQGEEQGQKFLIEMPDGSIRQLVWR